MIRTYIKLEMKLNLKLNSCILCMCGCVGCGLRVAVYSIKFNEWINPSHSLWSCGLARWCTFLLCIFDWIRMRAPIMTKQKRKERKRQMWKWLRTIKIFALKLAKANQFELHICIKYLWPMHWNGRKLNNAKIDTIKPLNIYNSMHYSIHVLF